MGCGKFIRNREFKIHVSEITCTSKFAKVNAIQLDKEWSVTNLWNMAKARAFLKQCFQVSS